MHGREPAALAKTPKRRDELKSGSPVGFFVAFVVIVVTCACVIVYRGRSACAGGWIGAPGRRSGSNEMVRYLGLCPYQRHSDKVLVVGSRTAVGAAVVRELQRRGVEVVEVKHFVDVDVSAEETARVFDGVPVRRAIVVVDFMKWRFGVSDGGEYVMKSACNYCDGLGKLLARKGAKAILALVPPYLEGLSDLDGKMGWKVVFLPNVVDAKMRYASDNVFLRVVRECRRNGKSVVEVGNGTRIESVTADEAARFLIAQMEEFGSGSVTLRGSTSVTLQESLRKLKCRIDYRAYPHTIRTVAPRGDVARIEGNVKELMRDALVRFHESESPVPYVSLIMTGRVDDGSVHRVNRCLERLASVYESCPTVDFEVVIVSDNPAAKSIVTMPASISKKVKWDAVDDARVNEVALKRASGEFVMFMSYDNLVSHQLFELLASRPLNNGILYLVHQLNITHQLIDSMSLEEAIQLAEEPWKQQQLLTNDNLNQHTVTLIQSPMDVPVHLVMVSREVATGIAQTTRDGSMFYNTSKILPGAIMQHLPCTVIVYPSLLFK